MASPLSFSIPTALQGPCGRASFPQLIQLVHLPNETFWCLVDKTGQAPTVSSDRATDSPYAMFSLKFHRTLSASSPASPYFFLNVLRTQLSYEYSLQICFSYILLPKKSFGAKKPLRGGL